MTVELTERPNTVPEEDPQPRATGGARELRELAERLDVPEGYRVEILGGQVIVSPRGSSVHSKTMLQVVKELDGRLAEELECLVEYDVESANDSEYEPAPDVLVVPRAVVDDDLPRVAADVVEMAVEVVSRSNFKTDYTTKTDLYARWGIPIYLIVDPRDGTALLQYDPDTMVGEYRANHRFQYGAVIELPAPLSGIHIDTSDFRQYREL